MTQQEIFKNMTKGEWKVEGPSLKSSDFIHSIYTGTEVKPKWLFDIRFYSDLGTTTDKANAHAINAAVNNTYGKGINPEAVEDLRDALEYLLICQYNEIPQAEARAKKALEKAKL